MLRYACIYLLMHLFIYLYPRDLTPEKSRITDDCFTCSTLFFHLWPPIWAHMGPYGPVWTSISFYIVFIWIFFVFTLFYMILDCFINGFKDCWHILKLIWHLFYHTRRQFQVSFFTFVYCYFIGSNIFTKFKYYGGALNAPLISHCVECYAVVVLLIAVVYALVMVYSGIMDCRITQFETIWNNLGRFDG